MKVTGSLSVHEKFIPSLYRRPSFQFESSTITRNFRQLSNQPVTSDRRNGSFITRKAGSGVVIWVGGEQFKEVMLQFIINFPVGKIKKWIRQSGDA